MDVRAPQSETTHIPPTKRTTWNSISNRHATDGDTYTVNSLEKLHFHMADVCLCVWFPFFPTKNEVKKLRMSWGWMHYLQTKYSWRCAQLAIFPIHLIQFFHAAASAVAVFFDIVWCVRSIRLLFAEFEISRRFSIYAKMKSYIDIVYFVYF